MEQKIKPILFKSALSESMSSCIKMQVLQIFMKI